MTTSSSCWPTCWIMAKPLMRFVIMMVHRAKSELLALLANMLRDELGWEIEPQNIALTNGSQSIFLLI